MPDPNSIDPSTLSDSDQANFMQSDEQRKKEQESGELELTPELVEQIMEKVVDVNASGLAVHAFGSTVNSEQVDEVLEKAEAILTEGLLGSEESPDPVPSDPQERKERWYKNTRSRDPRKSNIHFLILGKGQIKDDLSGISEPIKLQDRYSGSKSTLSILFDISSFREISAGTLRGSKYFEDIKDKFNLNISRAQSHTYARGDIDYDYIESFDAENIENGTNNPNPINPSGYAAYVAPFRISPKLFRGISFNSSGSCLTKKDMANKLSEIMTRVHKSDPKHMLPVYDIYGGLIWPLSLDSYYTKIFAFEKDIRKSQNQRALTVHEIMDTCYEHLSEEDREELKEINPNDTLNYAMAMLEEKGINLLDLLAEKRVSNQAAE